MPVNSSCIETPNTPILQKSQKRQCQQSSIYSSYLMKQGFMPLRHLGNLGAEGICFFKPCFLYSSLFLPVYILFHLSCFMFYYKNTTKCKLQKQIIAINIKVTLSLQSASWSSFLYIYSIPTWLEVCKWPKP